MLRAQRAVPFEWGEQLASEQGIDLAGSRNSLFLQGVMPPMLCVVTEGIKADYNHLLRSTTPTLASGLLIEVYNQRCILIVFIENMHRPHHRLNLQPSLIKSLILQPQDNLQEYPQVAYHFLFCDENFHYRRSYTLLVHLSQPLLIQYTFSLRYLQ